MKVTTIHAAGDIRLEDRPEPQISAPTDAVIKITAGCICGSDLWPYRGENPITPGSTIGHEMVGVIEEVGAEGDDLGVEGLADPGEHLQGEVLVAALDAVDGTLAGGQHVGELLLRPPTVLAGVPDQVADSS